MFFSQIDNGTKRRFPFILFFIVEDSNSHKPSVMIPPLTEGQQATLTCTAASLCSGSDPNITWIWRGIEPNSSYSTENITASQGPNSTLTFTPSAKHHSTKITCVVRCTGNETTEEEETATLNVTYVKTPEITGQTTVKEGDALNLTCSVDSFPPSVITWTKDGVNKSLISETGPGLNNDTGTSTLVIQNVTAEDSGKYFCTAKHPNTQTQDIIVTVMLLVFFSIPNSCYASFKCTNSQLHQQNHCHLERGRAYLAAIEQ
uniref:Ig-like domain-containing protein n=1 Tax=Acanthochromis polyacanthus TaxID=80966 RepID=A0A3Q1GKL1_9TELE